LGELSPAAAQTAGAWDHLVDEFCSRANLFCSLVHLRAWVDPDASAGDVMAIENVAALGREAWADVVLPP
jgi:hypothetical protein